MQLQSVSGLEESHAVTSQIVHIVAQSEELFVVDLFYVMQQLVSLDEITSYSPCLQCCQVESLQSLALAVIVETVNNFGGSPLHTLQACDVLL